MLDPCDLTKRDSGLISMRFLIKEGPAPGSRASSVLWTLGHLGANNNQPTNHMQLRLVLLGLLLIPSAAGTACAATLPAGFTESLVAGNIGSPTAMEFAPDGRLFVCQQGGQLRVIKNGVLLGTPFLTMTTDSTGERGLLGITFDPGFASNQRVYIYYTVP